MKNLTRLVLASAVSIFAVTFAAAQDPVAVDAKHYKVEFENEQVRVLRINYGAKEKSVMHQHSAAVVVALSETNTKFTFTDGKSENRSIKAGQAMWTPAGTHLPENRSSKPFEAILVELKDGSSGGAWPDGAGDPVKVSAKHHKLEFENDRVRVLRGVIGPREKTGMHGHTANVVIFLTDARAASTGPDGKTAEAQGKAGQVTWRGPLTHDTENLENKGLEVIVIELKGK